jgi:NTE family protein
MSTRPRQHAVVFSGNGYNAAYEAGVLKAILHGVSPSTRGEKIQPDIYAGTSVGAYNAAFMVSRSEHSDIDAVEKLEQNWHAGVTPRFRANPFDYMDPRFYLRDPVTPLVNLGRDALCISRDLARRAGDLFASFDPTRPFTAFQKQIIDFEWDILADMTPTSGMVYSNIALDPLRKSPKKLRITAADWKKGTTRTFKNQDFTDEAGHQIITAAMAIPGIIPRQRVELEEFVDGAMLVERPLQPAIDARNRESGARLTLHVIYLDPEFEQGPLMDMRGSVAIIYRLFMLAFSRSVNADIERIERINRALKFLDLLQDVDPDSEVMKLWGRLNQETKGAVEVEVHRYRSARHLSAISEIFIGMSEEKLRRLIETGYTDGRQHNCQEAGCLLISQD